jgi:ABC-type branched-subunit amino acid transport system substrate-binding protein
MINTNKLKRVVIASVGAIALVGSLVKPAVAADPGVTPTEIKLGISSPTSGSAGRVYGKLPGAMRAYFNYINANGGVNGRKIKLISYDDGYLIEKAAKQTTKLVIKDNVFALVGALGTATHTKAYKSAALAAKNVPDLFVNTGYSGFADKTKYPTTFTILPSYAMEAKIMAKYIKDNLSGQPFALFAQADEFGKDGIAGFTAAKTAPANTQLYPTSSVTPDVAKTYLTAISATPIKLVILFGTTDVTATVLKAAEDLNLVGKLTFMAGSVGGDANTLLTLGVKPTTIDGLIAASFFPDAKDTTDEYVARFTEINSKYNPGVTFDNVVLQGMNSAMLTVQALRAAGKNLTRAGLISAIESKGATFASAGLVPLNFSATSRVGYNGYWFGKLNAKGELKPATGTTPVVYTTDSGAGDIVKSDYKRLPIPAKGIPNN